MKEPTAINDSTLLAFYNYNLNSNIDKINQIRNETENLDLRSASDSTILSNNDSLLQMTMIMIENCAKSFDQGNISEQQYNSTLDNLKQAIENINNSSKKIAAGLKVQRETQAESIRTFNNLISSTKVYELNEKFVNDLYLRTVAKRIMEIPTSDQPQLLSIAHECPFVGGQAVYKARALYRLVNPIEAYDDYPLCHSLGFLRKRPSEDRPQLESVVYPNPSNNSATLAYSIAEDTKTTLEIFDFSLKLVATTVLNTAERQKQLNLENYIQGLYIYNIIQNNHVVSKGKFSIVR